MRRREFVAVAATAGIALPFVLAPRVNAQTAKVARVGVLESWAPTDFPSRLRSFREGLGELGQREGQSFVIEYRSAYGSSGELPRLAAELVRQKVDVIFAPTTASALAAKRATDSIPIVIAVSADPIGAGLVSSLARPGGNVTGLTTANLFVLPKRLQLLLEILGSRPTRIGMLIHPADASNLLFVKSVEGEVRALGLETRAYAARSSAELEDAFEKMAADSIEALMVAAGLFDSHVLLIAGLAAKRRIPSMYGAPEYVEVGGLMSFSASFADNFRRAASYVDKILKGAPPATLPVEQASRFEFVVNLRSAQALGIEVPSSLLVQATRVIE